MLVTSAEPLDDTRHLFAVVGTERRGPQVAPRAQLKRHRGKAKDRLGQLEEARGASEGSDEARRRRIRENAHYANRGRRPLFEITEAGDVVCARDGRPVTDPHQTLAEKFYWMEVGFGGSGLAHDEQGEALYTLEGGLALSRTYVHLGHLMGDQRMRDCVADDA